MATKKSSSKSAVGGEQLSLLTDVVGGAQLSGLSLTTSTGPSVTPLSTSPPSSPSEPSSFTSSAQPDSQLPPAVTKARSRNSRGRTKRRLTDPMDKVRPSRDTFAQLLRQTEALVEDSLVRTRIFPRCEK